MNHQTGSGHVRLSVLLRIAWEMLPELIPS